MADSVFTIIGRTTRTLVDAKLDLTGGTLTGPLVLPDPTQSDHAVTRGFLDSQLSNIDLSEYARLDGAVFSGDITLKDGNKLGVLNEFYAGLLIATRDASIDKAKFDAVASNNTVTIIGDSSPFAEIPITISYTVPSELKYTLTEIENDGVNTTCRLDVLSASKEAYEDLQQGGIINIGGSIVTFTI